MPSKLKRIIFLLHLPLSRRDYDRFGIAVLEANGFAVETWDVSRWVHPQDEPNEVYDHAGNRTFAHRAMALQALRELDAATLVIPLFGYNLRTRSLFRAIARGQAEYAMVNLQALPPTHLRRRWQSLRELSWRGVAYRVAGRVLTRVSRVPAPRYMIAAAEGSRWVYPARPGATTVVQTHALDYDIYLERRANLATADPSFAVFLDEFLPFHPDFRLEDRRCPIEPDAYYAMLRGFFASAERALGTTVAIAVHPRADAGYENRGYFGDRIMARGRSLDLVAQSTIIFAHSSTAVGYAVMLRKPLVFLVSKAMERTPGAALAIAMAGLLKRPVVKLEQPDAISWSATRNIDADAYAKYERLYIKGAGTPDLPLWQIVADHLHRTGSALPAASPASAAAGRRSVSA